MEKIFNRRTIITFSIIVFCIALALLVRSCSQKKEANASINSFEITLGKPLIYADSTSGGGLWVWEFGNGEFSSEQSGKYYYKKEGKYQIRLTVNGTIEKKFMVYVKPQKAPNLKEELIQIIAPTSAMQGEYIVFKGEGNSKEWRWGFGENAGIDAREKTAVYKYAMPGTYEVLLTTEETQYPIRHIIEIKPQYMEDDSTDALTLIGNDIKEKLQAIVNQKSFNANYNYIMSNYLCNNSDALVVINNVKKNDIYSYCQGLRLIGKNKTTIENVLVDMDETETCVEKIIVIQSNN